VILSRSKKLTPGTCTSMIYRFGFSGTGSRASQRQNFCKQFAFCRWQTCFCFLYSWTHPELFFPGLVPLLKSRGLTVIGTRDWYGNCPFMPQPYHTYGHPDEVDLKEAEEFGQEMVERSRKIFFWRNQPYPSVPQILPGMPERKVLDLALMIFDSRI